MKKLLAITALSAALFFGQTAAAEEKAAEEVKPSHVEMVLVLDESGSMSDLTRDTIGGFNSMIEKEKKLDVDAHVTTVLFNDQYKMLYNRRELKDVRKMTDKDYTPGGMTALLDAVGRTIHKMDMVAGIHRKDKGNKVLFVIITDGEENDSKEYTYADVKKLIKDRQENAGWEFIFLGANIDAAAEAENLGIDRDRAVKYKNTGSGVRANFMAVAELSDSLAKSGRVSDEWKSQVEEDRTYCTICEACEETSCKQSKKSKIKNEKDFPLTGKSFSFLLSFGQKWKFTAPGHSHKMVIFVYADKKKSLYRLLILFSYQKDLFLRRILPVSCSI